MGGRDGGKEEEGEETKGWGGGDRDNRRARGIETEGRGKGAKEGGGGGEGGRRRWRGWGGGDRMEMRGTIGGQGGGEGGDGGKRRRRRQEKVNETRYITVGVKQDPADYTPKYIHTLWLPQVIVLVLTQFPARPRPFTATPTLLISHIFKGGVHCTENGK